ncbi:MAG TPA: beta-galactosidase small subunit, partial [Candidatus Limiplasma sp.]|nr:beta-galactosidase small subunit [Candidatus Limiplasma sp.]
APLINFPPRPSLYRAPLDNDMANRFPMDTALWQVFSQLSRANTVAVDTKSGQLVVRSRYELPSLTDAALEVTYTVLSANRIRLDATIATPRRMLRNLPELPALGLNFRLPRELANVRYYGLGPQENETDRCAGALLGIYQTTAEANLTPYLKPQYCGNRTGVRWLELSDGAGRTLRISKVDEPLMVSVLPYSQAELTSALHRQELPDPAYTWLDVAAARFGVGGDDTWGAPVLPAYRLKATEARKLSFVLEAL